MRKRILWTVLCGICLGLILLALRIALGIDEDSFMRGYWRAAPVIILGALLCNTVYVLYFHRKLQRITKQFLAGETKGYIADVEALLRKAKGRQLRALLKLNLAAGYLEAKEFDTAVTMLEELSHQRLYGAAVKLVHRINLCMAYFYTERYEKAMEWYVASQKAFAPYRQDKRYGGSIAELDILAAICARQYGQAEELLDRACETWQEPRLQASFREIRNALAALCPDDGAAE